jgi:hypothetical protein
VDNTVSAVHIHLLLNHIPILGSIFGLLLLLYAILRRSDEIKKACFGVFVITALITIPVYLTAMARLESSRVFRGCPETSSGNTIVLRRSQWWR